MHLELKKGDKVLYKGHVPYKLGNGQEIENHNEELEILKDTVVQSDFFELVEKPKVEKKK